MPQKENIQRMFDDIAPEYDKLNHIMSFDIDRYWRKLAVKEIVSKHKKLDVLDVACGTGDFAIEIAKKAVPGSTITGIDISNGLQKDILCQEEQGTDIMFVYNTKEILPFSQIYKTVGLILSKISPNYEVTKE